MRVLRWCLVAGVVLLVAGIVLAFLVEAGLVQTGAWIRIDCGDLVRTVLGLPYRYGRIPRASRARVLAVSTIEPPIPSEWHPITASSPDRDEPSIWQTCYRKAAAWVDVDAQIARLVVEDMANFLKKTGGEGRWEGSVMLFKGSAIDMGPEGYFVKEDWRTDPVILKYLLEKGYELRE